MGTILATRSAHCGSSIAHWGRTSNAEAHAEYDITITKWSWWKLISHIGHLPQLCSWPQWLNLLDSSVPKNKRQVNASSLCHVLCHTPAVIRSGFMPKNNCKNTSFCRNEQRQSITKLKQATVLSPILGLF